ncbi:MAG: DNA repair protein RadA [Candidatus Eisenbacteria bacterium]|uniref:DNA repair protein RadA n=1 Tax=Eiseniibacteriota bacterium TaxID=2212470 RepID=A0A7Y2EC66_UNCEI|nr:DNA repair protein RadA [Candidatus Eisenbacteria bacterium]
MKKKSLFVCTACEHSQPKWTGQCSDCGAWNTLEERVQTKHARHPAATEGTAVAAQALSEINIQNQPRYKTRLGEFDRVLGGGLVPGSLVLLAGDPGVGKSTLLLQVASAYAEAGLGVLYLSAEESASQIRRRSHRLKGINEAVRVLSSTSLESVAPILRDKQTDVLIVDSVQTLHQDSPQAPGSVAQVRDNTLFFLELAKQTKIPVILVGHVTKEGSLAGPRVMEHLVDCVLYLEGDHYHQYRLLRAAKNRFGATQEVGVFEMGAGGLIEVINPSESMLAQNPGQNPGSAVLVTMEGTRPLLLEVQALISGSGYNNPRRVTTGYDSRRLAVILAVLERHGGLDFSTTDVFVNIAGGFKVLEPAASLAVAMSLASSFHNAPLPESTIILGEVGLGGEIRAVSQTRRRLQEAAKLGYKSAMVPKSAKPEGQGLDLELQPVDHIKRALEVAFGRKSDRKAKPLSASMGRELNG